MKLCSLAFGAWGCLVLLDLPSAAQKGNTVSQLPPSTLPTAFENAAVQKAINLSSIPGRESLIGTQSFLPASAERGTSGHVEPGLSLTPNRAQGETLWGVLPLAGNKTVLMGKANADNSKLCATPLLEHKLDAEVDPGIRHALPDQGRTGSRAVVDPISVPPPVPACSSER